MLPKKDRGEDALFISSDARAIGLADGVGGWAQHGINPFDFPETLMAEIHQIVMSTASSDVLSILNEAYLNTHGVTGSSTVVLAILDSTDVLRTITLGDSGFRVIRNSRVVYASIEQQHSPNKPYQLGTDCDDMPESGILENMRLMVGDYIVFGTDGLFDNLFDEEIIDIIATHQVSDINQLAFEISVRAQMTSYDAHAITPYALWVRSLGVASWVDFTGGKRDDITAIVARVVQNPSTVPKHPSQLNTAERVVGKPGFMPDGSEKQYCEYMIAMREFEVFENLLKKDHVSYTILPYFIS